MHSAVRLRALVAFAALGAATACGLAVSGLGPVDGGPRVEDGSIEEVATGRDAGSDVTLDVAGDALERDTSSSDGRVCTVATCAVDLALGPFHSCAILAGGAVRCWGSNELGQLGFGAIVDGGVEPGATPTPGPAPVDGGATQIVAGGVVTGTTPPAYNPFSCALLGTGDVACWGGNADGELGGGAEAGKDSIPHATPSPADIAGATRLTGGGAHACALAADAAVLCWGRGDDGQLGRAGVTFDPTPEPPSPSPEASVTQIATGGYHSCVRERTGAVECWGLDNLAQLGRTIATGNGFDPAAAPVPGLGGVQQIAAGYVDVCAVLDAGSVACWGYNASGELGRGTMDTFEVTPALVALPAGPPVVQVAIGAYHACAVRADGSLWCWGYNGMGQLGVGTVDSSGTVVTPNSSATPLQVPLLPAVARVACGAFHTCAIMRAGPVFCWGANDYGQLGGGPGDGGDGGGIDDLAHVEPVVVAF
ncbi:MAG TPA: hypothetical protein VF765_24855 [Polyangiaceae bacterium]